MDRIERLENRSSHMEKLIDDLNNLVFKQQGELEQQKRLIEKLKNEIKDLKEEAEYQRDIPQQRPPHY
jgi:uncharacterized coiled-coil protein SlyX